jgi:hypothetical protein
MTRQVAGVFGDFQRSSPFLVVTAGLARLIVATRSDVGRRTRGGAGPLLTAFSRRSADAIREASLTGPAVLGSVVKNERES